MLTNKKYLTILFFLMLVNSAWAQWDVRLTSAYGKVFLNPETNLNINAESENFITAGIQADYYITDNFGFGFGADYYMLDNIFDVVLSDYSHSYEGIDNWEGDPVPRRYRFSIKSNAPDIIEQNTMTFIDFPVSAVYSFRMINDLFLTTRLGLKMGLPLKNNYRLENSDLYTRLYFEEWDLELFDIPAHGLYDSRTDWHPEGELNLNNSFSAFSELGVDFPVSLFKVRLSGYFSIGLNNLVGEKQSSLIYWREDYNYILSLSDEVNLMQYGIKLGIGIITKKEKKKKYNSRIKCAWEY